MSGPSGLLGIAGRRVRSQRLDLRDLPRDVTALAGLGIATLIFFSVFLTLQTAELVPGGVFGGRFLGEDVPRLLPVAGFAGFAIAAGCLASAAMQPGGRRPAATLLTIAAVGAFLALYMANRVRFWLFDRTFAGDVAPSAVLPWPAARMIAVLGCAVLGVLAACALAVVAIRGPEADTDRPRIMALAAAPFALAALAPILAGFAAVRLPVEAQGSGMEAGTSGAELVGLALAPLFVGTLLLLPAYWTIVESAHATRDVARSIAASIGRVRHTEWVALGAVVLKVGYLALGLAGVPLIERASGAESLRGRPVVSWVLAGTMALALAVACALPRQRVLPDRGLRPAVLVLLGLISGGAALYCVAQFAQLSIVAYNFVWNIDVGAALDWTVSANTWEWGALPAMLLALLASIPLLRRPATRAAGFLCLVAGIWGVPLAALAFGTVTGVTGQDSFRNAPFPAQVDVALTLLVGALLVPVWRRRPAAPPVFLLTVLAASTIAAHASRELSGNSLAFDALLLVVAIAYLFLLDSAETNTRGPTRPARVLRTVGLAVFAHALAFAAISYGETPGVVDAPARYFIYTPLVVVVVAAWFMPELRPSGPRPPPPPPEEAARLASMPTTRLPRPPWWRSPAPAAPPRNPARSPGRYAVLAIVGLVALGALKTFVDGTREALAEPPYGSGPWVRVPVPTGYTPEQLSLAGGEALALEDDAGFGLVAAHLPASGGCAGVWAALGAPQDLAAYAAIPLAPVGDAAGFLYRLEADGYHLACYSSAQSGFERVVFLGAPAPFDEPAPSWRLLVARIRFGVG